MTKNSEITTIKIDDQDFESYPEFYRSPSGSPILEVLDGITNIEGGLIRLESVIDTEIELVESDMFNPSAYSSKTIQHGVKDSIPLIFVTLQNEAVPIEDIDLYVVSNAFDINETQFTFEVYNNGLAGTLPVRIFIYKII